MNQVQILVAGLDTPHNERALLNDLSDAEHQRYHALRMPEDRLRYLLGHSILRRRLAIDAGIAPRSLPLDVTCARCGEPHGRPRMAGPPDRAFRTSISHAAGYVAVAVGDRGPIGVDIELLGATDWPGFDEFALTVAERGDIAARARTGDRTRLWTRKEAVLKALGRGLLNPLDGIDLAGTLDRLSGTVLVTGPDGAHQVQWLQVEGPPGYALTLAAAHDGRIGAVVEPHTAGLLHS